MGNYKNYCCFTCHHWYNCGKEEVNLNYKFNRDGSECHAYDHDPSAEGIVENMRIREFESHIEYLVSNRVPRMLW